MKRPRRKIETRIVIENDDTCEYKDQEKIHIFSNKEVKRDEKNTCE